MSASEVVTKVESSSRSRSNAGAIAGLAVLIFGAIANIAWDLSMLVTMARLAFAD